MSKDQVHEATRANVSITRAVYFDSDGVAQYFHADEYDADQHAHLDFHCADCWDDKGEVVRLKKPSKGFLQTNKQYYFDENLNQYVEKAHRFFIPPRFTLMPNQSHVCDLVTKLVLARQYVSKGDVNGREFGASNVQKFNLNIPCGQDVFSQGRKSGNGSMQIGVPKKQAVRGSRHVRSPQRKLSEGIKDISQLAEIIQDTEFHPQMREEMLMNIGSATRTLGELFHKEPKTLFRYLHAVAQRERKIGDLGKEFHACAFVFRPQSRKFGYWERANGGKTGHASVIRGLTDRVISLTGRRYYYPQVRLHFANSTVAYDFERAFDIQKDQESSPSFLVYSERAYVDLFRFASDVRQIRNDLEKDAGVFVDVHVSNKAQYALWDDVDPQQELLPMTLQ